MVIETTKWWFFMQTRNQNWIQFFTEYLVKYECHCTSSLLALWVPSSSYKVLLAPALWSQTLFTDDSLKILDMSCFDNNPIYIICTCTQVLTGHSIEMGAEEFLRKIQVHARGDSAHNICWHIDGSTRYRTMSTKCSLSLIIQDIVQYF